MEWTPEQRKAAGERLRKAREAKANTPKPKPQAKPMTWATLPIYAPRCAKAPGIPDDAPVHQMRCVECREPMWTRDEKREDVCETCDYNVRERIRQMGAEKRQKAADRLVVPGAGDGGFINPIKSGGGLF